MFFRNKTAASRIRDVQDIWKQTHVFINFLQQFQNAKNEHSNGFGWPQSKNSFSCQHLFQMCTAVAFNHLPATDSGLSRHRGPPAPYPSWSDRRSIDGIAGRQQETQGRRDCEKGELEREDVTTRARRNLLPANCNYSARFCPAVECRRAVFVCPSGLASSGLVQSYP